MNKYVKLRIERMCKIVIIKISMCVLYWIDLVKIE